MAIAVVKTGTRVTKTGGSGTIASSVGTVTIGNYVVCIVATNCGFVTGTTFTTPAGWSVAVANALSGSQTYRPGVLIFYKVSAAGGTETCTLTLLGTDAYAYSQCIELSGVTGFDSAASIGTDNANGTATTDTVTSPSATAVADSIVFAVSSAETGSGGTAAHSSPASLNGSTIGVTSIGTNANDTTTIAYDASRKSLAATATPSAAWTWTGASRYNAAIAVFSGTAGGGSTFTGDATDSLSASDAETAVATFAPARAETLTAADVQAATFTGVAADAETLSATDAQSATMSAVVAASETLTAAESSTAQVVTPIVESLSATDSQAGQLTAPVARAETLSATDSQDATVTSASTGAATDALSASDSASATVSFVAARAETLAAADSQSAVAVFAVVRTESLAALDAIVASAVLQGVRVDVLAATDAQGAIALFSGSVADVLAASDIATAAGGSVSPPSYLPSRLRVADPTSQLECNAPSSSLSIAGVDSRMLVIDPTSTLELISISSTSDLYHG